ncbi:TetR/AcrR family transcriptional regulator [Mycobacterium sp. pUA109]|uniref:TetR/AcrR family transcriptional regulator n=1 Tax=Mycobacterium sp. pUA109 TaxID=3238982 RepID=UPI00351B9513
MGGFRSRLLEAMRACIAENGYTATTVADVVRCARTSRRTFYEHFVDKEDCFVAVLTDDNATLIRQISTSVDPKLPWQEQIRQAVTAWINYAESHPAMMLSWIRDAPRLGATMRDLQRQFMEGFIAMMQTLSSTDHLRAAGIAPVPRQRAIMLLGGLRELTATTLEQGGQMTDIADEAVQAAEVLLAPFAGA